MPRKEREGRGRAQRENSPQLKVALAQQSFLIILEVYGKERNYS